ncbi:MAG: hypothetical protein LKJ76_08070 [Lachnospiraceae bacterium]|jgi:hypothetical protein|nr:hypothetical protein [Lachnospiraceae bacterium]
MLSHKKGLILVLLITVLLTLAGCSGSKDSASTAADTADGQESGQAGSIAVAKNGEMTVTSVESFSKDYYSKDELQAKIDKDADAYNNGDKKVDPVRLSVSDGQARLVMKYSSSGDYAQFNDTECFYGTLSDALLQNIDMSDILSAVSREDTNKILRKSDFEALGEHHVFILTEQAHVTLPYKILYSSPSVSVVSDTEAEIGSSVSASEPAVLILEK